MEHMLHVQVSGFLFYAFIFNWKWFLRNLLKAPVCDASTFKIGQVDTAAAGSTLLFFTEQIISSASYGGIFGQAYTNENCCLRCTQTPGCVSWVLQDNPADASLLGCYLLSSRQSNFKVMIGMNSGNILPNWPHADI